MGQSVLDPAMIAEDRCSAEDWASNMHPILPLSTVLPSKLMTRLGKGQPPARRNRSHLRLSLAATARHRNARIGHGDVITCTITISTADTGQPDLK
jgi:hypothetical protein